MGQLRILLLFVVYLIVRIGDFVSLLLLFIKEQAGRVWNISRYKHQISKSKSLSETEVLYRSKKSLLSSFSIQKCVKAIVAFLFSFFNVLLRELGLFLLFFLKAVLFFVRAPYYLFLSVFGKKKKRVAGQNSGLKTKFLYFVIGAFSSFVFLFVPLLFFIFVSELPHPSQLSHGAIPKTTKIFDRDGELLYEIYVSQNRTPVMLSEIPTDLINATIAIEDKNFYSHPGFDVRGMSRAFYENTTTDTLQGGSTITQQLIKSALLTPEPTISRKVKEVALAFWAERIYSKGEILEMYFNFVPYGGTAWGISAAAETYFGKDVTELSLSESAFLAGLPRAPSVYSPFVGDGDSWRKRQKVVLDAMVKEGYITSKEAEEAFNQPLAFSSRRDPLLAPHFVMYVRDLLIDKYGISAVERGGLQVTTSLDLSLQRKAEEIVYEEVEKGEALNITNGAALVTNPTNGDVLAMVGSHDYFDSTGEGNVNVTRMRRQPGSTIKLVTYALALESGYTEATILNDTPLTVEQAEAPAYKPVNYDGEFHGRVPLRIALANSYNIPAVRVAQDLGADKIVEMGKRMGISSWENISNYGLSITLGGSEVTMMDLAAAYGAVANEGRHVEMDPLLEVRDSNGRVVYEKNEEIKEEQVVSSGTAFILSDILADNKARSREFGSNSPLHFPNYRVSVKTGTTDEKRDNWTVGYFDDRLVAAWVGNNDNSPMSPELTSGLSGAAPIWRNITEYLLDSSVQPESLTVPDDLVVKECYGRRVYLRIGTEDDVRCPSSDSTIQRVQMQ